ncbi:MAG: hypothetical protein ACI9UD_001541 [Glaciecola sp.]|jgi:hypothetical protein
MNRHKQLNQQLLFNHSGALQQTVVNSMLINYIIANFTLTLYLTP